MWCSPCVPVCSHHLSSFYKDTSHIGLRAPAYSSVTSSELIISEKILFLNKATFTSTGRNRFPTYFQLGGHNSTQNNHLLGLWALPHGFHFLHCLRICIYFLTPIYSYTSTSKLSFMNDICAYPMSTLGITRHAKIKADIFQEKCSCLHSSKNHDLCYL